LAALSAAALAAFLVESTALLAVLAALSPSLLAASAADLLLLVFDAAPPWNDEEQSLVDAYPDALVVINKCDQHRSTHLPQNAFATSALTGEGVAALIHAIGERLVPAPPQSGEAVPFTSPQVEAIAHALQSANSGELSRAAAALRQLLR
jgi:tRNA modification GTPase